MSDKKDLTRIEDLSEYLHEEDPEVDRLLNAVPPKPPADVDSLDELPPTPMDDDVSEFDYSSDESEDSFEASDESSSVDDVDFSTEDSFASSDELESEESFDSSFDNSFDSSEDSTFSTDSTEEFESDFDQGFESSSDDFSSSSEEEGDSFFEGDFDQASTGEFEQSFDQEEEVSDQDTSSYEEPIEAEAEEESFVEEEELPSYDDTSVDEVTPSVMEQTVTEYAAPSPDYRPETFSDVKSFAQSVSYGAMAQGGNPPFSVMLRNIKFKEDCEDIFLILKDHGLITPDSESDIKTGLDHGSLLVSQLSEYCAIFLAHKLRRFDLDIQIGLSDELHPSKSYTRGESGPINKSALMQNKEESFNRVESPIDLKSVVLATSPSLEGYRILRYLGIISEHALVKESELEAFEMEEDQGLDVGQTYSSLAEKLKVKALKKGGNAVLNVNYQFSPLPAGADNIGENTYKVTCTGNVVWVTDNGA